LNIFFLHAFHQAQQVGPQHVFACGLSAYTFTLAAAALMSYAESRVRRSSCRCVSPGAPQHLLPAMEGGELGAVAIAGEQQPDWFSTLE
jgi:hypothetical protein